MKQLRFLILSLLLLPAAPAAAQVTGLGDWSLYIDPGHSQTENQGIYGYSEAEKNLRVGLALRKMLLETTDIDTVYISRTNDQQSVTLSQRSDHANQVGASWFHSIHSDAGSPGSNSTLLLWGQYLNGEEKVPPGGREMSDLMVERLSRGMRIPTRGSIGDCTFYRSFITGACSSGGPYLSVNRRTTMPSELSEAGFHTSPVQNTRNMNADWKTLEAKTFYWSILDFHHQPRPGERIVTGFVTNIETGEPINGAVVTLGDSTYTTDTYASLFNRYSNDPGALRNGFYYFGDVAEGTLSMTVEAEGFIAYAGDVTPVDTFFTFQDVALIPSAPPGVVATAPAEDSTHRVIDPIIIDFSRLMDRASTEAAFGIQPETTGRFAWREDDFQLVFIPDSIEALTDYTITIAEGARGVFGDGLDGDGDGAAGGDFVLNFRTGFPDVTAPAILVSYPRVNAENVERDPIITFTFDEVLDSASVTNARISLEPTSGGSPAPGRVVHYVVGERSLLSFFPEDLLDAGTRYRFAVEPGLEDRFGNEITTVKQFTFETEQAIYDVTPIDAFDGGLDAWWVPQQSGSTTGIVTDSTGTAADTAFVNHLGGSTASMRLDYGWNTSDTDWLIRVYLGGGAPYGVLFDSTYTLQAYVFGDGSGNQFRFAVDDNVPTAAASNHEVSPWHTIDWYGWRLVSWRPARDGAGAWLGDGDVEGTLRFDSIQLTHTPGSPAFGTLYMDDLRYVKATMITADESTPGLPARFELHQNYPNPFNPSTTLRFDLASPGDVTLNIFDILGKQVATLVDQKRYLAGSHELTWNASGLPSGVYFARLEAAGNTMTVQLVLMK